MGSNFTKSKDFQGNEYLERFVGNESIDVADPFWNRFLSFTYKMPLSRNESLELDTFIESFNEKLRKNNSKSGNLNALIEVFTARSSELKTSALCHDSLFIWQTCNALFILRCIFKHFVQILKEEDLILALQKSVGHSNTLEDGSFVLDSLSNTLIELIVDVPESEMTFTLHLEAITTIICLLASQLYASQMSSKSLICRSFMKGKCSIHACLLMKTLMNNYIRQDPFPVSLSTSSEGGSLIVGLANGLINMLNLSREAPVDSSSQLSNMSVLLMLVLVSHCTTEKHVHNPYRQALFSFTNTHDESVPSLAGATFKVDYDSLYSTLCDTLRTDQITLLLYLLIHRNITFCEYILRHKSVEKLVVPVLKILYHAPENNSHHVYMALIVLLKLSEDGDFSRRVHGIMISDVMWYTERQITELSLGGLLILVIIRTIQFNMTKMRDKYLHTNCLAALANMSNQFVHLHQYVCQRLISLLEILAKKYFKLSEDLRQSGSVDGSDDDISSDIVSVNSELVQDVAVLEEVLRMLLEIINSALVNQINSNLNLLYSLLYKKCVFEQFNCQPNFQDVANNIEIILSFFCHKLEQAGLPVIVSDVQEVLRTHVSSWPKDRIKKLPELKFKYVEEENPEDFFVPYVWNIVCTESHLYWDTSTSNILANQKCDS